MYKDEYTQSIKNKKTYFESQARTLISWDRPFTTIQNGNEWFTDGYLNACYNVIDRNCSLNPYKIAVIYETNEGETVKYTYLQCQQEIMKIANYLKYRVGDKRVCVAVYMPNSDQLLFTILACARLGLPHNVIFGGFTAESISLRIKDSNAKIVFTVDKAKREKKIIDFYANVINACHMLKKENYDLDCLVVYDKNEISLESIVEIVLWNDVLKGEIYDRDELRLGTPKRVALSKDKESVILEQKREYKTDEEMHIEKEMIVKPRVKLDLDAFVPCVSVKAENELFYLYTSGSTGKPKGLVHTTGGYLTYAALTTLKVFNVSKDDVFCSTADIGWITGHTYSVYGPLALGCTIVLIGGIPTFPSSSRSFEIIEKHKITHFYTAPTVIRMLQKNLGQVEAGFKSSDKQSDSTNATNVESVLQLLPDDLLDTQYDMSFEEMQKYEPSSFYRPNDNFYAMGHDLSSLRILGTVGEPINKEAYVWYKKTFGPYLPVIDTYWQTEAGGIMISAIPYQTYPVPECACVPFYGMEPMIMKEGREIGTIVFEGTWPGIARTILNDYERYESAYFSKYKNCYYTGDEGYMDNGYFFIRGREDDVLNVAGHRMSTAEIESACCSNEMVVETAAVGVKDTITEQAIVLFCVKKSGKDEVVCEYVKQTLREKIGPVVKVKRVYIVSEVPKTRTGKIMRRVLRDIIEERELGDLSTCNNVDVIEMIKEKVFGSVDEKTEQGSFVNV